VSAIPQLSIAGHRRRARSSDVPESFRRRRDPRVWAERLYRWGSAPICAVAWPITP